MQIKRITKCQFFLTITESELLIVEGYSKLFASTVQASALTMCVNGWNTYAKLMTQYSKNCRLESPDPASHKLLQNMHDIENHSDEAVRFRKSMSNILLNIKASAHGHTHSVAE